VAASQSGQSASVGELFGVSSARVEAAELLRRLGNAFVSQELGDAEFELMSRTLSTVLEQVESCRPRDRSATMSLENLKDRETFRSKSADSEVLSQIPDCVVSGAANPMGFGVDVRREGDQAVSEVALGPAFEGPPGRVHGGVVAAIFDDLMVHQLSIIGEPAFTGRIEVTYRAPTPLGIPLEFRARLERREGRKLYMAATACRSDDDVLVAESTATFIVIPLDGFSSKTNEEAE